MNKQGDKISYLAIGGTEDHAMLPEEPANQLKALQKSIWERWSAAEASQRGHLGGAAAVLGRLNGFFLQVRRLSEHAEHLYTRMLPGVPDSEMLQPGMSAALAAEEVCTDFESLLFHSRAVLDRLALFVNRAHGGNSDKFDRLSRFLGDFEAGDSRAAEVRRLLEEGERLRGILTKIDGSGISLRSLVTHRSSIAEGTTSAFTVQRLMDGRVLFFDCEALNYGVLATAHTLTSEVPFIVLNTLAIYLRDHAEVARLDRSAYEPSWTNHAIVFSDLIDKDEAGPLFSVYKMIPDGFTCITRHLIRDVTDMAIEVQE